MTEFIKTIDGEFVREDKIVSIKKTEYFDNVDSHLIIFAGIRNRKTLHYRMLVGFHKVDVMLDELEKVYRESECVRGLREE